jgi:hypothetical protein
LNRLLAVCGLLAVLALSGCGAASNRSQADQDRDGRMLAAAIQAADAQGVGFSLDESLVLTGGDVPSGQEFSVRASSSDGVARDGKTRFTYRVQSGGGGLVYEMVTTETQLFARRKGSTPWLTTPLAATTSFFPALRLELLRETVLLAGSVAGPSLARVPAGLARKYVVKPAPDQLEQLQGVSVQGQSEAAFLKSAGAEVHVFLGLTGDHLERLEVHLAGTDPSSGARQRVDSSLDVRSARVGTIKPPDAATSVPPENIFG